MKIRSIFLILIGIFIHNNSAYAQDVSPDSLFSLLQEIRYRFYWKEESLKKIEILSEQLIDQQKAHLGAPFLEVVLKKWPEKEYFPKKQWMLRLYLTKMYAELEDKKAVPLFNINKETYKVIAKDLTAAQHSLYLSLGLQMSVPEEELFESFYVLEENSEMKNTLLWNMSIVCILEGSTHPKVCSYIQDRALPQLFEADRISLWKAVDTEIKGHSSEKKNEIIHWLKNKNALPTGNFFEDRIAPKWLTLIEELDGTSSAFNYFVFLIEKGEISIEKNKEYCLKAMDDFLQKEAYESAAQAWELVSTSKNLPSSFYKSGYILYTNLDSLKRAEECLHMYQTEAISKEEVLWVMEEWLALHKPTQALEAFESIKDSIVLDQTIEETLVLAEVYSMLNKKDTAYYYSLKSRELSRNQDYICLDTKLRVFLKLLKVYSILEAAEDVSSTLDTILTLTKESPSSLYCLNASERLLVLHTFIELEATYTADKTAEIADFLYKNYEEYYIKSHKQPSKIFLNSIRKNTALIISNSLH